MLRSRLNNKQFLKRKRFESQTKLHKKQTNKQIGTHLYRQSIDFPINLSKVIFAEKKEMVELNAKTAKHNAR